MIMEGRTTWWRGTGVTRDDVARAIREYDRLGPARLATGELGFTIQHKALFRTDGGACSGNIRHVILEIRTYRLRPGTMTEFVRVMREESLPLCEAAGIRIVAYGPSLVAEDGHEEAYLIRQFDSLEQHATQEQAFYSSDAWLSGPRDAIVSRIESYHTVVFEAAAPPVVSTAALG